jgi:uncharacterized delta-60 repeat protein
MNRRTRSALAGLFASALLIAMTAAAANAEAAGGPGTLDPSFGTGGKVLTSLAGANQAGNQALVSDAALQPNGDIVISGSFGLLRYLPNGKLDTSFGTGGVAQTGFGGAALAIEPNGEFVVAGQSGNDFAVARLTTSGALDTAFGRGGVVTTAFPNAADGAAADAVLVGANGDGAFLPDGQSLIAGTVGLGRGATDVQLHRFDADGSTDPAFSNPPFAYATPGDHESPAAIAVAPNGQIEVVGAHFRGTSVFGVARLDAGGSLDSGFANAGVTTTNFQADDIAEAVVVQPDGDIVAAGFSEDDTTGAVDVALARYLG